jgi:hypothetical protein
LDTEGTIATVLADATGAVSGLREAFRAINASGGHLDFFVGLFVDSMTGFDPLVSPQWAGALQG